VTRLIRDEGIANLPAMYSSDPSRTNEVAFPGTQGGIGFYEDHVHHDVGYHQMETQKLSKSSALDKLSSGMIEPTDHDYPP